MGDIHDWFYTFIRVVARDCRMDYNAILISASADGLLSRKRTGIIICIEFVSVDNVTLII